MDCSCPISYEYFEQKGKNQPNFLWPVGKNVSAYNFINFAICIGV